MKTLEKKVHFRAEGTFIGCYDSNGKPVNYILLSGTPYIELDKRTDRLLRIDSVACHSSCLKYYHNYSCDRFAFVDLRGVINGTFIASNNNAYYFAERSCSNAELASYYLAKYKAYKNAIKMEATK